MFEKVLWDKKSITELEEYLDSIKNVSKIEWTKRVINTNLDVLAIKLHVLKEIARKMKKGNFFHSWI